MAEILSHSADQATKRAVLLVATLAAFLTPFTASSINIALPSIQAEFHVDTMLLTWIPTSYLLSTSMFLVPFGKIADLVGRRRIFVYGISIFTFASCLSAVSLNVTMLLCFRVLQGMGTAMIFGTGMAMLATVFPPGERGKVIGINVATVYIGLSAGPFLGGLLTEQFTWRGIFAATVPLGILTICVSLWKLKWRWQRTGKEKFDVLGSLLYAFSIVTFMLGLSDLPSLRGVLLILVGICFFILFVRCELRSPSPVLNINLFKNNRAFAFSSLAALINYSATFAVTFLLSLYLQYLREFSPRDAGLVLMAQPITMAILSPIAGRISDRVEPQKVASSGMFLTALGLLLLSFLTAHTSLALILMNLILLGCGFALFSSPNMNAIMNSVDRAFYGIASGVVGSMRLVGQMLSMGLAAVIFALYIGPVHITPEIHPVFLKSLKAAFTLFAIICFIGILASLARGKILPKRDEINPRS
jgi:EmrB/QacA subfamily drug resistance transporter